MFAARRAAGVIGGVAAGSFATFASWGSAKKDENNSAFVFIKPHANTPKSQALVSSTLKGKGITISTEGELTGEQIDHGMLIDQVGPRRGRTLTTAPTPIAAAPPHPPARVQHYYAIASKATLLKPKDMPVPADKFEAAFGLPWAKALEQGNVFNALDACKVLGVEADGLDALWAKAKKSKFGGGFCACSGPRGNVLGLEVCLRLPRRLRPHRGARQEAHLRV